MIRTISMLFAGALTAFLTASLPAQAQSEWDAARSCRVATPEMEGQPRLSVAMYQANLSGKAWRSTTFELSGLEQLSAEDEARFEGVRASTLSPQATLLDGVVAVGRNDSAGYKLTITVNDIMSDVLRALSNGDAIEFTIPTNDGDKTVSINLTGSRKAIGYLRDCLG